MCCPPLIFSSLQNTSNLATQVMVFREQLSIAIAHKKPICLHVRNADPEAFEVMKSKEVVFSWFLSLDKKEQRRYSSFDSCL